MPLGLNFEGFHEARYSIAEFQRLGLAAYTTDRLLPGAKDLLELTAHETIAEISKQNSPTGQRYTVKPHPTNDQQRTLKIGAELTGLLVDRIDALGLHDDLPLPSTPRHLQQPTSRNTFRTKVWRPAVLVTGLPTSIRVHDLRHAHASSLLAGGADLKTVIDRLGHTQISTTQRYLHTLDSADDTGPGRLQADPRPAPQHPP